MILSTSTTPRTLGFACGARSGSVTAPSRLVAHYAILLHLASAAKDPVMVFGQRNEILAFAKHPDPAAIHRHFGGDLFRFALEHSEEIDAALQTIQESEDTVLVSA